MSKIEETLKQALRIDEHYLHVEQKMVNSQFRPPNFSVITGGYYWTFTVATGLFAGISVLAAGFLVLGN